MIDKKNSHNNPTIKDIDLLNFSRSVLKVNISNHILSTYDEQID